MNPFTETKSVDIYRLGKNHPAPIPELHYKIGALSTTNYKDDYELVGADGTSENETAVKINWTIV